MKPNEAALIIDPKTSCIALAEIEYYGGFNGIAAQMAACEKARNLAAEALRDIQKGQVCETCIHYKKDCAPLDPEAGCKSWKWRGCDV